MSRPVTDAAAAASERARSMPLTPVDPPAAVIRALEDAALPRIDPETARRFLDLDRRFDRTVSALRQELARRQEHAADEPVAQPASGWDMTGFVIALVAAPLLLVAGGRAGGAGSALPTAAAVWASTALVVVAGGAHAIGAVRARRAGRSVASSRHLVLLTAAISLAVAGLIVWRAGGEPAAAIVVACVLAVLAAGACVILFVPAAREAGSEARTRRAALDAERARRVDLEAGLAAAIETARSESWELLGSLTAAQREELRAATTRAVAALGRRQLLEPDVLRDLRAADAGQLRYSVGL
ncbi:hypothetical protein ACFWN7_09820 [Agromyces sp. NPDC058484]|uniref:hypothetical protein n=1 Tax=Agromyces sp. NPDC058484 TaxID=3346524 RepID=UPI00364F6AC4